MNFLRNLIASIFGTLIALGIIFILIVLLASAIGETDKISVKENTVLEIKLEKTVKDFAPKSDNPIDEILGLNDDKIALNEIINAIENAKDDANIKGISINTMGVGAGMQE